MVRHRHNSAMNRLLQLLSLKRFVGEILGRLHQVDELAALIVAGADTGLQRVGRTPRLAADEVACLIGSDREQPGPEAARRIELLDRLVNLQKRFLEYILSSRPVSKEPHEKVK